MNKEDFIKMMKLFKAENISLVDNVTIGEIDISNCIVDEDYILDRLEEEGVLK